MNAVTATVNTLESTFATMKPSSAAMASPKATKLQSERLRAAPPREVDCSQSRSVIDGAVCG